MFHGDIPVCRQSTNTDWTMEHTMIKKHLYIYPFLVANHV